MQIREALRSGLSEIRAHKMRSFLSFFAISIGTAAFMYTFSMIANMSRRMALAQELSGPGRIVVGRDYGGSTKGKRQPLTYADALAVQKQLPELYMVSPTTDDQVGFAHGKISDWVRVVGVLPERRKRDWVFTLRGRFINDYDVANNARVAVLVESGDWPEGKRPWWVSFWSDGENVFDNYVKHTNLLGDTVKIQDHTYTVIGILKRPPRGEDPRWFRTGNDGDIMIPLTTRMRTISVNEEIDELSVDTGREDNAVEVKAKIESILASRRNSGTIAGLRVRDFREIMHEAMSENRKWMMIVLSIGIISILAGGIGIMNVTLATVYSRIKEIGIRRALGASRGDIIFQFVVEAALLGLLGGLAGVAIGYVMVIYMRSGTEKEALFWWVPFVSVMIAVAAGFIFSIYPAYTASRLDPVEALRYE